MAGGEERDERDGRREQEQRRAAGGGGAGIGGTKSALAVQRGNRGHASEGSRFWGARPRRNRVQGGGMHLHSVAEHITVFAQSWGARQRATCQALSQTLSGTRTNNAGAAAHRLGDRRHSGVGIGAVGICVAEGLPTAFRSFRFFELPT